MERIQKQTVQIKELERQQGHLTQLMFRLSDALTQKSDLEAITEMINEVTQSLDLYMTLNQSVSNESGPNERMNFEAFQDCYAKHMKGIKRYYHLENFNRLTMESIEFYSDLMMEQLNSVENHLECLRNKIVF